MKSVEVGRYGEGTLPWIGWVCTDKWIAFEASDGRVLIFERGEGGGVIGEPMTI